MRDDRSCGPDRGRIGHSLDLVSAVEGLIEGGLDEEIVRAVLDEVGAEYVDDVRPEWADYFVGRCVAIREEME